MTLVKKKGLQAAFAVMAYVLMALPMLAGAQFEPVTPGEPITGTDSFFTILSTVFAFLYSIFFAIAAFFILWAAFTYLTAGGSEDKVEEAKNRLVYAVIAIVVALISLGIDNIVADLIGVSL